ncbi:UNVERIFIED_CONTAM: B3 domain-containing protein REM16 [Sesamum latifolium]|uniref:B3 domain-containing protein REM16 n=1 Tax=Sesamum latifolium TaxID=2727402 RepID=A0AAW2TMC9_9LAMI
MFMQLLPPNFVQKYGEILPQNVRLRTSSGETWNVEMEQVEENKYYFTGGWTKFARDVGLGMGEFLVFSFNIGESTFDVSVYGISGCERVISPCNSPVDRYDPHEDIKEDTYCDPGNSQLKVKTQKKHFPDQDNGSRAVRSWKFSKELTESHFKDRLSIPKHFAIGTGIATNREITLVDGQGRELPVKVTDRNDGRFAVTAGWRNFLIGNQVPVGSHGSKSRYQR